LRILIADDERPIRRFLRAALTAKGHTILEAVSGTEAISAAAENHPDVIFLDLGLPDMDGVEVIARLREWSSIPIIVLSVRDQEEDKIKALDAGADDYLTKPFGIGELLARMRGVLRRATPGGKAESIFQSGSLRIDFNLRQVSLDGQEISLTPTEYDILRLLVQNAGKVLTHRQIITGVWGAGYADESHLLRVNISNLRRKIETDPSRPQLLTTEPGVGYRLRPPEVKFP
jgi:two-component system, OmpR family, KDP operon response regulator KdpE